MNVQAAIEMLQAIEDKSLHVFIDCPHCERANEVSAVTKVVVLKSEKPF